MKSKLNMHAAEASALIIRQGDVLLQPIPRIGVAFEQSPLDADGSATLAHGEVTGHRHRFAYFKGAEGDDSSLSAIYVHPVASAEVSRVRVLAAQPLVHEEHSAHEIPAGSWRVSRPFEYTGTELPRMVED